MNTTVSVRGLKGLEDALVELGPKLARRAFKKGMEAAAAPMIASAKAKAPLLQQPTPRRRRGELRDSIGVNIKVNPRRGTVRAKVGPTRTHGESNQSPGAWGLMEEFGSIHNPPQPYLRPAFDAEKEVAVEKFAAVVREQIETLGR